MASINRKSEIETQTEDVAPVASKRSSVLFSRLFSVESTVSNNTRCSSSVYYDYRAGSGEVSLCSKEFILKLLQEIISITCACLYSNTLMMMKADSITSLMYPSVVFSASIIITTVIILSYVLGYVMFDVIIRIFNAILLILYFICGCITGHVWYASKCSQDVAGQATSIMLLVQTVLSFVNFFLYAADIFWSIKKAINVTNNKNVYLQ